MLLEVPRCPVGKLKIYSFNKKPNIKKIVKKILLKKIKKFYQIEKNKKTANVLKILGLIDFY